MRTDSLLDTMYNNLDKKIRQSGLAKRDIARRKGIAPETLSRHVSGKIHITKKDADEYAAILGCTSAEVLYPIDPMPIIASWSVQTKINPNKFKGLNDIYHMQLDCSSVRYGKDFAKFPKLYMKTLYSGAVGAIHYNFTADEYAAAGHEATPWWTPNKYDLIDITTINESVDPSCHQQMSYCRTIDGRSLFGYLYPEPGFNNFTVYVPESPSFALVKSYTGQKLRWACPILGSIFRPDLRNIEFEDGQKLE